MIDPIQPPPDPFADIDRLGNEIAELSAHIQAATYQLLVLIREFDDRHGWNTGFRSCAHWLNWRTGLDLGAAREKVRVARALEGLPEISEAMRQGQLSYSKVRALTRVATSETEAELLEFALSGTAAHIEKLVRGWRRVDRIEAMEEGNRQLEHRYLRAYPDEDGMLVVRARLTPEVGAVFLEALEAANEELFKQSQDGDGSDWANSPAEQRRADALELVAESALEGGLDPGTAGDRYQVVVHVQDDVSAETQCRKDEPTPPRSVATGLAPAPCHHGLDVSAETSRRLACDCGRIVMRHDSDGRILDVGRKTRTIHPALRRALEHRDRGCRFPGCGLRHCDAHHVEHWAEGGRTELDNLLLLCRFHHRELHEGGFRVELAADGSSCFYTPRGALIPEAPLAPDLDRDPVESLKDHHRRFGIQIDSMTGFPRWEGESFDLGHAIDALRVALATDSAPAVDSKFLPESQDLVAPAYPECPLDVSAETSSRNRQGRLLPFE
jgi:hypothetical protein